MVALRVSEARPAGPGTRGYRDGHDRERLGTLEDDVRVLEELSLIAVSLLPPGEVEVTPERLSSALQVVVVDTAQLEEALEATGAAGRLAGLELQGELQRDSVVAQMITNVSKVIHETARRT